MSEFQKATLILQCIQLLVAILILVAGIAAWVMAIRMHNHAVAAAAAEKEAAEKIG